MKLEEIKDTYEKANREAKQAFLQNFGKWLKQIFPSVKSFTFCGDDQCYNDEDYYSDLEDFLVDGESIRSKISLARPFYEFINPEGEMDWTCVDEEDLDLWEPWEDIAEFLKNNCPNFIKEENLTYKIK